MSSYVKSVVAHNGEADANTYYERLTLTSAECHRNTDDPDCVSSGDVKKKLRSTAGMFIWQNNCYHYCNPAIVDTCHPESICHTETLLFYQNILDTQRQ
jgi:hypothetical protein